MAGDCPGLLAQPPGGGRIPHDRGLPSHRGGVMIWEYEQILQHRLFNQAWGRSEPEYVTRWLAGVSGIQNGMYRVRSIAAGALVCTFLPLAVILYWIFYPGSPIPSSFELGGIATIGGIGWLLNKVYRHLAPNPW